MNAAPLLAPDDDRIIAPTLLRRVVESLTRSDVHLLLLLEAQRRIDVALLALDAERMLWLAHFGLFGVEVDFADRVYIVKRLEGKAAISAYRGEPVDLGKRRRGRRAVAKGR